MKLYYKKLKQCALLLLALFNYNLFSQTLLDPFTQPQFVNPLPIPSVIDARNGGQFSFDITQFQQNLGLINPVTKQHFQTTVWGYNGTYPGPTIVAKENVPVNIFWNNKLVDASNNPLPHLLPLDASIHWAFSDVNDWQQWGVPTVTHLHGGHTESASDGLPDAWYTPNFTKKGPGFIKGDVEPFTYHNSQEAATLWYHDHALGITRLNAYAGLAGFYLITDANESNLQNTGKLPATPYDIGLAIQDKNFTADGQLYYPSEPHVEDESKPSILPESFGNFILVNGKAWPVLDVEPRQYRFRLLNASDSRFYNFFLTSRQSITQIASDDGLLPSPVILPNILIAPGERKDVIIDFSDPALWGQTIVVRNIAKEPYPRGSTINPNTTGRIMAFKVNKTLNNAYPLTSLPTTLRAPIIPLTTTLMPRKLILFESNDHYGRLKPMLGTFDDGVLPFHHEVTENPALNSNEIWEIYNETEDAHPIHLHQVAMQLVSRQKFKATIDPENGKPTGVRLLGNPKSPSADEAGWKDTYVMYPGEVTRVIARFDLPGMYVWHCHILSHEDNEMMRPFFVGPISSSMMSNNVVGINASGLLDQFNIGTQQIRLIPNPFSNVLKIELALDKTTKIAVNLYDTKGSHIQQVYLGQRPVGKHQFTIDGSKLANGTYFCEIMINDKRIIRKVILEK